MPHCSYAVVVNVVRLFKTETRSGALRIAELLSLHSSTVYKWDTPSPAGGNGLIPQRYHRRLVEGAPDLVPAVALKPEHLSLFFWDDHEVDTAGAVVKRARGGA